ncbi:hypothetical protein PZ938_10190 [Luteipulveratus sp. YIM 133132]|uniref:hypothetical protein n=1 Tax=Luteipulveratus flavus TaxID=3031728 RepID=UPI0023B058C8|nr:hypothetical protein [Luteipulveratus sp. YIM 133132]MDE9365972.1 hypothetical protein [Luteipulveratus sp. YIM 133132]
MKFSLACPACSQRFEMEIPDGVDTLWGTVSADDLGCAEVTIMGDTQAAQEHLQQHLAAGDFARSLRTRARALDARADQQEAAAAALTTRSTV